MKLKGKGRLSPLPRTSSLRLNQERRKKRNRKPASDVSSEGSSDEDRNRTPSGTMLKGKVTDIRTFLEKANKLKEIGLDRHAISSQPPLTEQVNKSSVDSHVDAPNCDNIPVARHASENFRAKQ